MKIVVLNESFLTKSHIEQLNQLGEVVVYDSTDTEKKASQRLKDVDIAVIDGFICPLNATVLSSSNQLKFITLNHTGYDMVDMDSANNKGIKIANVPGFSTESVAEHVIALMFAVVRHIPQANKEMHKRPFEIDPANEYQKKYLGFNVLDKTLGIIGLGSIGRRVAELGNGLGMKVVGCNRTAKDIPNVELLSLKDLLKRSDVVSINLALSPEVEYIIGEKELSIMKPSSIIINTARGKHINTQALYNALKEKKIFAAGLDVLEDWSDDNPLVKLDNVVLTPHEAFFTEESLHNMADIIINNIKAFVQGNPSNIVNS